jgi:hypothetical protein
MRLDPLYRVTFSTPESWSGYFVWEADMGGPAAAGCGGLWDRPLDVDAASSRRIRGRGGREAPVLVKIVGRRDLP